MTLARHFFYPISKQNIFGLSTFKTLILSGLWKGILLTSKMTSSEFRDHKRFFTDFWLLLQHYKGIYIYIYIYIYVMAVNRRVFGYFVVSFSFVISSASFSCFDTVLCRIRLPINKCNLHSICTTLVWLGLVRVWASMMGHLQNCMDWIFFIYRQRLEIKRALFPSLTHLYSWIS